MANAGCPGAQAAVAFLMTQHDFDYSEPERVTCRLSVFPIDGESSTATVNGELLDGTPIEGADSVNIVKDTCT